MFFRLSPHDHFVTADSSSEGKRKTVPSLSEVACVQPPLTFPSPQKKSDFLR